jgi:cardiolipin synthase
VYEDGRSGLAAMLEAVEQARERIHFETYILRTDAFGRRFADALAAGARRGVAVRLLYDGFGSRGLDPEVLQALRRAGAEVVAFNPLRPPLLRWLPRRRDHRKILTVDGRLGFTGGLNVGDEYAGREGAPPWRDTHLRLRGPIVRDLDAVFLESWFRADGPDVAWHELLERTPRRAGSVRCALLPDGPVYRRRRTRDLVVAGLLAARRRVCFASPYFAPGAGLLEALAHAARRGVRVDLLVAGEPTDHPSLRRAARALFPPLLAAGLHIHEYEGAMMHAKVAVFDGAWASVGTANLDRQSLRHSYEVSVVLEDPGVAGRLEARFGEDLARARRVDALVLARRDPLERVLDALAALLLRVI